MKQNPAKRIFISACMLLFITLNTACNAETATPGSPTPPPPAFVTATLPPTQTPRPSPTPVPATDTPIPAQAEGQTTSQLNVRSKPSAAGDLLGTIDILAKVQIVGKDPTSSWWLIVYPQSPSGTGWVTAQYVQASNAQDVPVIGSGQVSETGNAAATAADPNVGTDAAGSPTQASAPALATAYPDGDSAQSPAVSITLSQTSVRSFHYSSDISTPEGDPEDWVQFQLEGQTGKQMQVSVTLNCSGSSALNVGLIQSNVLLQGWDAISCDHPSQLQLYLYPGAPYTLHLFPAQGNLAMSYVAYTVTVQLMQ